jgi:signal transduction histidine kinase
VAPVLEDIALVLAPEAERRGVSAHFAADAAPDFRGDAEDLTEIVGALAENAVQWARTEVRLTARRDAGCLLVEIADDGPGIPADQRERLLTRGARLDETTQGHGHGHGLGLAIAADRVRAYGGKIVLGDSATAGLSAQVTLPARS